RGADRRRGAGGRGRIRLRWPGCARGRCTHDGSQSGRRGRRVIPMTLAQVADTVGGRLTDVPDPDVEVTGTVEFDSRRVRPGGLFLALAGARSDGHDFAASAIEVGAVAVIA